MKYDLLIIDGSYLAHKSYDAPYRLTTNNGRDATMIHSFMRSLNALNKQFKPNQIIVTWESPGTTQWRKQANRLYKKGRARLDKQYVYQQKDLQRMLCLFDILQYKSNGNEADDVMAKLTTVNSDNNILIYTVDKDIMQLVNDKHHIYSDREKKVFDIQAVKDKYGVYPHQIPDLLAIVGDKSDNIEGIEGYGYKKAIKLLEQYDIIEQIPNTEPINKHRIKLLLNKRLTKLNNQCQLVYLKYNGGHSLISLMNKYQLEKMKEKIEEYKSMGGVR
jgi:DNA polymerase I